MRTASIGLGLSLLLSAACSGAPPAPAPMRRDPPTVPDAALPVAELRYVAGPKLVLGVHADGRVERPGAPPARIVGRRLVCADGFEILHLDEQDRIVVEDRTGARLMPDGGFAMLHGYGSWSMIVLDDGAVSLTTKHEGTVTMGDIRWEGFRPEVRRTASLLSALLTPTFGGRWCR